MANDEMRFRESVAWASRHKPETAKRFDHGEVRRRLGRGLGRGHDQRRHFVPDKGASDNTAAAFASVTSTEVASAPMRV
jgi:hypothetical protein